MILLIGDGMGFEHVRLGSYVEYGNDSGLFVQQFLKANMTTFSADDAVTDSAASATAIATGTKTNNGYLSLLPNGTKLQTILEYGQSVGHKTGLVSTTNFYHATPAAFASHQDSRYNYDGIINDMMASGTDVVLAGGFHLANLRTVTDFDTKISSQNYTLVENRTELMAEMEGSGRLFGSFGNGYLPYEAELDLDNDVRLHQMAQAALNHLEGDDGFFLMIEGGRIDHGGHANNPVYDALEVIEFDRTVKLVHEWAESHPNTLVIVTADHETGGLSIDDVSGLDSNLPGSETTEDGMRQRRIDRVNQISTSYSTTGHTSQDVGIFAFGRGTDEIISDNSYDNTDIFGFLKDAIDGVGLDDVPVSSSSSSSTSSTTSTSSTSTTSTSSTTVSSATTSPNGKTSTTKSPVFLPVMLLAVTFFIVGKRRRLR